MCTCIKHNILFDLKTGRLILVTILMINNLFTIMTFDKNVSKWSLPFYDVTSQWVKKQQIMLSN